ncbi:hypothetical protein VTN02DRAFT_6379 [Thermoascus thermophilus]
MLCCPDAVGESVVARLDSGEAPILVFFFMSSVEDVPGCACGADPPVHRVQPKAFKAILSRCRYLHAFCVGGLALINGPRPFRISPSGKKYRFHALLRVLT